MPCEKAHFVIKVGLLKEKSIPVPVFYAPSARRGAAFGRLAVEPDESADNRTTAFGGSISSTWADERADNRRSLCRSGCRMLSGTAERTAFVTISEQQILKKEPFCLTVQAEGFLYCFLYCLISVVCVHPSDDGGAVNVCFCSRSRSCPYSRSWSYSCSLPYG